MGDLHVFQLAVSAQMAVTFLDIFSALSEGLRLDQHLLVQDVQHTPRAIPHHPSASVLGSVGMETIAN